MAEAKNKNHTELNQHYYKSRNSLLLFSGLLFAWELIGIKFSTVEASGVNVIIENSEAVPFVLFVLLAYYVFRIFLEWLNSDIDARANRRNKIDLWVTLSIPFIATLTFSIQKWFDISVFKEYIEDVNYFLIVIGYAAIGATVGYIINKIFKLVSKAVQVWFKKE